MSTNINQNNIFRSLIPYKIVLAIISAICIIGGAFRKQRKNSSPNKPFKKEESKLLLFITNNNKLNLLPTPPLLPGFLINSGEDTVMPDLIPRHPILNSYQLQSLNSFNVPACSDHYIQFNRLKDIEDFCAEVDFTKTNFYILGGGSNTLFVGDFPGYILHIKLQGIEVIKETAHNVLVKAAAGVHWHDLVLFCLTKGYGGIENLSLIPGTVGAAPVQNIGAYGVELKDVVDTIETIELSTGKKRIFRQSECEFGYRTSIFKTKLRNKYLITNVILALHKEAKFSLEYGDIQKMLEKMKVKQLSFQTISDAVIAIRQQKIPDPTVLGNGGCFFQNPFISIEQYELLKMQYPSLVAFRIGNERLVKISAAWLIETAGFKGLRQGNVGVHNLHSLIIVNYGGATGKDIINLAIQIKKKVEKQFNITLIPEVNIVGAIMELK